MGVSRFEVIYAFDNVSFAKAIRCCRQFYRALTSAVLVNRLLQRNSPGTKNPILMPSNCTTNPFGVRRVFHAARLPKPARAHHAGLQSHPLSVSFLCPERMRECAVNLKHQTDFTPKPIDRPTLPVPLLGASAPLPMQSPAPLMSSTEGACILWVEITCTTRSGRPKQSLFQFNEITNHRMPASFLFQNLRWSSKACVCMKYLWCMV